MLGLDHTGTLSTTVMAAKEHAPEWLKERLAGGAEKSVAQDVSTPDETVH